MRAVSVFLICTTVVCSIGLKTPSKQQTDRNRLFEDDGYRRKRFPANERLQQYEKEIADFKREQSDRKDRNNLRANNVNPHAGSLLSERRHLAADIKERNIDFVIQEVSEILIDGNVTYRLGVFLNLCSEMHGFFTFDYFMAVVRLGAMVSNKYPMGKPEAELVLLEKQYSSILRWFEDVTEESDYWFKVFKEEFAEQKFDQSIHNNFARLWYAFKNYVFELEISSKTYLLSVCVSGTGNDIFMAVNYLTRNEREGLLMKIIENVHFDAEMYYGLTLFLETVMYNTGLVCEELNKLEYIDYNEQANIISKKISSSYGAYCYKYAVIIGMHHSGRGNFGFVEERITKSVSLDLTAGPYVHTSDFIVSPGACNELRTPMDVVIFRINTQIEKTRTKHTVNNNHFKELHRLFRAEYMDDAIGFTLASVLDSERFLRDSSFPTTRCLYHCIIRGNRLSSHAISDWDSQPLTLTKKQFNIDVRTEERPNPDHFQVYSVC